MPGFFTPRIPAGAAVADRAAPQALSYYDTAPLRKTTLERLVDFDLINDRRSRASASARSSVTTGNFIYFDNFKSRAAQQIGPEHIMASGALPPGFPPIEIDGEHYWDGGSSPTRRSNTCSRRSVDRDLLIFQVDLFPVARPAADNAAGGGRARKGHPLFQPHPDSTPTRT